MDNPTTVVLELMKAAGVVTDREAQAANFEQQRDTSAIVARSHTEMPINISSELFLSLVGSTEDERYRVRSPANRVVTASQHITGLVDGAIEMFNRQFPEPAVTRGTVRDDNHHIFAVSVEHPPETHRREAITLSVRRDAVGDLLAKLQQ